MGTLINTAATFVISVVHIPVVGPVTGTFVNASAPASAAGAGTAAAVSDADADAPSCNTLFGGDFLNFFIFIYIIIDSVNLGMTTSSVSNIASGSHKLRLMYSISVLDNLYIMM